MLPVQANVEMKVAGRCGCLDVPIPEPKSGEVLIRAHAIGVGMPDCLIRAGTYSVMPPLPATPGTELAGVIEKVGPGVTTRQEGQRVYTTARERPHRGGHYAEYVATPAEATFLLPDTVDFEAAAALANYQVAYHIFNDALCLRKGETVLIFAAAGGMGNALIDLAKATDLKVIGVVSSEEKARFVRDLGADHIINRNRSCRGTCVSRKYRNACALWDAPHIRCAWRKGSTRSLTDVALAQELAGGSTIHRIISLKSVAPACAPSAAAATATAPADRTSHRQSPSRKITAATPRRRRRPRVAPHPAQRAHHAARDSRARISNGARSSRVMSASTA
jgi:Alcohol dehydrogenase GroES-like domain/Zinc-binding dehydrogenase